MQDPQHTDENADALTVDGTEEPTDADPLLPEVEQ